MTASKTRNTTYAKSKMKYSLWTRSSLSSIWFLNKLMSQTASRDKYVIECTYLVQKIWRKKSQRHIKTIANAVLSVFSWYLTTYLLEKKTSWLTSSLPIKARSNWLAHSGSISVYTISMRCLKRSSIHQNREIWSIVQQMMNLQSNHRM